MQINPNNSNINFNKYNLSGNPLGIMPQHLISKVTSFLDKNSIQNIALLNNGICKSVKAAANFNESNLIKNFIQTLIQKLNVGIYPEQREQLVGIEQNIVLQNFANLRLLKEYILNVKEQIIGVIKTLDEETTNDSINHVQLPNFFENILELVAFERQIDVANLIHDEYERGWMLRDIFNALMQVGDIDRAVNVATLIPNEYNRVQMLRDIFNTLMQVGDIDRAINNVTTLIPDERERERTLMDISEALMQKDDIDRAINVATLIHDEYWRRHTLLDISKALMRVGDIDRAINVVKLITNEREREWALMGISKALLQAGDINRAYNVATSIPNGSERRWALMDIFNALTQAGGIDRTFNVATSIPNGSEVMLTLLDVSKALGWQDQNKQCTVEKIELVDEDQKKEDNFDCSAQKIKTIGDHRCDLIRKIIDFLF